MASITTQTGSAASSAPAPAPVPTFSIWPPSQRTRDAVATRLLQTLSTQSVLSKRYGTLPEDEATALAKKIEEEAFAAASSSDGVQKDDDGILILQFYSKEISKRMLEAVKSRSSTDDVPREPVSADYVADDKEGGNADDQITAEKLVGVADAVGEKDEVGVDDVAGEKDEVGVDGVAGEKKEGKVVAPDDVAEE